jgi:hypothetical protein
MGDNALEHQSLPNSVMLSEASLDSFCSPALKGAQSKHPENINATMPPQGVLTRTQMRDEKLHMQRC